jgi:hypothetical protein
MARIELASIGVAYTIPSSSFCVSPMNVPYPASRVSVTDSLIALAITARFLLSDLSESS